MKKKIVCIVLVAAVAVVAAGLFVPNAVNKITKENLLEIHGELLHQRIQEKKWDEEFMPFIDYCKNS